jgi:predicted AAA+ superfamily ATPase
MKRAYKKLLAEYLRLFPCVGVFGPRHCGKTTLLRALPAGWRIIDLARSGDWQVVGRDPDLFLRLHPAAVAFDEAQVMPQLFPALRVAIDAERKRLGRFVVTGSSSPDLLRSLSESLAGRIGIIEMAPLAWSEIHPPSGRSSLAWLTDRSAAPRDVLAALRPRGRLHDAHLYWLRGGYPEPWLRPSPRFREVWMDQFIRTYLHRDLARLFPGLSPHRFRLFLQLLAGLSGTIVNYSDIARSLAVSQPTVRDYVGIAHGTFLWRALPPFERDATKRIVKHPKGYLRDTGLLHALLRIPDLDALLGHPQFGRSWEGLVVEEFHRQLASRGKAFDSYFYRTAAGAEVDLVLEGDFGLLPIEIRHAQTVDPASLRALRDFVHERRCRLGVVVNNDETPRLYDEQILGIPFVCL